MACSVLEGSLQGGSATLLDELEALDVLLAAELLEPEEEVAPPVLPESEPPPPPQAARASSARHSKLVRPRARFV